MTHLCELKVIDIEVIKFFNNGLRELVVRILVRW